jgi:hypothetical protein
VKDKENLKKLIFFKKIQARFSKWPLVIVDTSCCANDQSVPTVNVYVLVPTVAVGRAYANGQMGMCRRFRTVSTLTGSRSETRAIILCSNILKKVPIGAFWKR